MEVWHGDKHGDDDDWEDISAGCLPSSGDVVIENDGRSLSPSFEITMTRQAEKKFGPYQGRSSLQVANKTSRVESLVDTVKHGRVLEDRRLDGTVSAHNRSTMILCQYPF